jgi:uncharacterized protein YkwD
MDSVMKKCSRFTAWLLTLALVAGVLAVWTPVTTEAAGKLSLGGTAHVQSYGDVKSKTTKVDGIETLVLGTRGKGKRVERITLKLTNKTGVSGNLQYMVHIQGKGWTGWINQGKSAGTTGQSRRIEAIKIRLTGDLAKSYDVRYMAHIQTYGDSQGWVYNGAIAGTTGEAKRIEEIRVQLVPKSSVSTTPTVSYRVHVQSSGWEKKWSTNGKVAGTTGLGKRLEGITLTVSDNVYSGGIRYKTHIQSYGWESSWKYNGEMSGTQGESKRLEAIKIELTGTLAKKYDVYYRVHAQSYGWLGWAKNGEESGTSGGSKRLEAIQVVLVKKGGNAPGTTYKGITSVVSDAYYNALQNYNDAYAEQVLTLINKERKKAGVKELTMNTTAVKAAKIRAKELTENFDHERPNGTWCYTAFDEVGMTEGVDYSGYGENIAVGYTSAKTVMSAWMSSEGHKANILDSDFDEVAIACYYDASTPYKYYWVQMFIIK